MASAPKEASTPKETSAPKEASTPSEAAAPSAPASAEGPGLAGGISIAHLPKVKAEQPRLQAEVKPLAQEDLERYWQEAAEEMNLGLLMEKGKPKVGEHSGRIEIDALSVYFNDEFKPHRIDVMELLRKKTGMPMLECKVNPLYIEKDEVIYSPQDKYKAMIQTNPKLVELRKIFPQIDY